jgi:hypothetical protein
VWTGVEAGKDGSAAVPILFQIRKIPAASQGIIPLKKILHSYLCFFRLDLCFTGFF